MRFLRASLILFAVGLSAIAGCRHDDDIQQTFVEHEEREKIHLRVAILPHGDFIWFFRVDGPVTQVKQHLDAFDALVKSVQFADQKDGPPITWTEPKEWKKDPPRMGRFASYRVESVPKVLELKITRLSRKEFKMMENMHRWQKQVNLPLSEKPEDNDPYLKKEEIGPQKQEVTWVNMTGLGVHVVSKAADPMANQKEFGIQMQQGKPPFKYTVPENWQKGELRGGDMADIYTITDGDQSAELTLTKLKGTGGGLAANINRWRGQVELKELPDEEIRQAANTKMIPGMASYYFDIGNPDGPRGKNRILAVIIPQKQMTWFVKMTGPHDLVGEHKKAFETFIQSIKK